MSARVLGSDKNYVSSEEGSRDPREVSGVAVWASLRRGVSAIQQAPCHKAPFSWLICQARETPSKSGREKRKRAPCAIMREQTHP